MLTILIESFIGLAAGIAVGTGFVAFLTVLGIIPRLMQLSKSTTQLHFYEAAVILGTFAGIYLSFGDQPFSLHELFLAGWGLLHGIFIGMLAAALTEVLNVFPLLTKRVGLEEQLMVLMMALVLGKITGSLFHWIIFVKGWRLRLWVINLNKNNTRKQSKPINQNPNMCGIVSKHL
jgi:stage V sporulation protein AB